MSAKQEPGRLPDLTKAIIQIHALLNSTLVIDEIMGRIAEKAAQILDCDSSFIVLREDSRWRIKFGYQLPQRATGDNLTEHILQPNLLTTHFGRGW